LILKDFFSKPFSSRKYIPT